jgi:predicted amidophosphoribosyltransferase
LGKLLARAALPYAGLAECVVPVPLHPRKLRKRGYNQSALLAAHVARALGLPLSTRVLQRRREALPQAGASRGDRARNVQGAFRALSACPSVLLIDDVRTSGATLAEASRALRDAGCPQVRCLCLAAAPS